MHRRNTAIAILSLLFSLATASHAAAPITANAHAEHVQRLRQEAGAVTGKSAKPEDLRKGVARLEQALAYLDRQQVRELGGGNMYLYARGHDVRLDLAALYARLGMKEQALSTLEAAQRILWVPDKMLGLGQNEDFVGLRGEPRFGRILQRAGLPERLWAGPAADVPYRDKLTVEERIAGLTQFWSEARSHFVYFDHVPDLDWNRVYLDTLPKVMAAETTRDYYRVLMQVAPLLKDGHTNIYPPEELVDSFYARPPIRTALVENRVLVEHVSNRALANDIRVGDEIVAIDGLPVQRHAEERVAPFVSSSTPQDRLLRMFSYQLLSGDAATPVALTVRGADGSQREVRVTRKGIEDLAPPAKFAFRMLPDGVAYIAIDHFESDAGVKAFEAALPDILKAKALVIDVRRNGGGSTGYAHDILSYLGKHLPAATPQLVRSDDPYDRAQGGPVVIWRAARNAGADGRAARPRIFTGKVAVLTGARTFSAAEDFVLAFKAMKRGVTVGETTGGSTGQPLFMRLPGGGTARICIKRDLTHEGREFVGEGIVPDVPASQSVESFRAGRDLVLERALVSLRQNNAPDIKQER